MEMEMEMGSTSNYRVSSIEVGALEAPIYIRKKIAL